jgi:hypothetical protein
MPGQAAAAASAGALRGSGVRGAAVGGAAGAGTGAPVPDPGAAVALRGGGRPVAAGALDPAGTPDEVGGRVGVEGGAAGTPAGFVARGHAACVPLGMRAGGCPRGADGVPAREVGRPGEVVGRAGPVVGAEDTVVGAAGRAGGEGAGAAGARAVGVPGCVGAMPGGGPGTGVRTGGRVSNAGPGRGTGVKIGGPERPGGSSSKGKGVRRGGGSGTCRRSSPMSRLRIFGGGRDGRMPGSHAVQSPSGGNSAPHLRHLDTAA